MKHPLFKQKAKAQTSNNMKCNFLQCERFREISKASNEDCEKICAAFFPCKRGDYRGFGQYALHNFVATPTSTTICKYNNY